MIQVSTQEELRTALLAQESEIQIISDFNVDTRQNVTYPLLLRSAPSSAVHTLFKTAGFSGSLFYVSGGGMLTLENLVLDGSGAGSYLVNPNNRTLVQAAGGTVHLGSGSVLQNNSSYQEGGGLYLSGESSYVNTLLMDGDAVIRDCSSRTSGGGLAVALRNHDDSVRLAGTALIEQNTAANGAGAYLRSYLAEAGGSLSIGEQVQIQNNHATTNGGGIYCSSFSTGGSAPVSLLVEGTVKISSNLAANGGGIYFYSASQGDRLTLTGLVDISKNSVTGNGGGVYLRAPRDSAFLSIQGASITGNHAHYGGGLYLNATAGGTLEVTGQAALSDNEAAGAASSAGGGMWIQNVSGMLDISFLFVSLLSNQAAGNGAGLFLSNSGSVRLSADGGSISGNIAGASGGGIYLTGTGEAAGTLALNGVTVLGNTAGTAGGGLYLGSGAALESTTLDNSAISGNTAQANSGGGIWSGNTLLIRSGTVITQNSSNAGNGGGVYFNSDDGSLTLSGDAKITYNRADSSESGFGGHGGGVCVVPGRVDIQDQAEISHNSAGKFGGGLSAAEESVVTMSGGSIHDNQSGQEGGGIWNHVNGRFTQTGGSIINNAAQIGGGIYNDTDSIASIQGGVIQGNNAAQYASGVYNAGILYTQGLRELANGLYIENRGAVAFLSGALEEGTALQLENSGYVAPNSLGTPIVVGEATPQYPRLSQADANGFQKPFTGFDGWEIRLNEDRTQVLLAPAVYTLRYENTMGEQNPNPASYTVLTPAITLIPLMDTPGSRFLGWFDALEGGAQVMEIPQGSTGDRTLYARWQVVEYTVTYYGNDASGPPAENVPQFERVRGGESVLLSDQIPTRTGYVFISWNTDPAGTGTDYPPGATIPHVLADTGLYARWEAIPPALRVLTYEPNDADGPPAENIPEQVKITQGDTAELSTVIPTRAGYRFLNWNHVSDGSGIVYQPGETVGPFHSDLTVYAQWQRAEHILTYHGNDQAGPPAQWIPFPQPVPEGVVISLPGVIPTREGFRFTGWNTRADGSGIPYQPNGSFGPIFADTGLYAQWAALYPTIRTLFYYGNDAGGPAARNIPGSVPVPDGRSVTLSSITPAREGFIFSAWNTDPAGTGTAYWPGDTIPDVRTDIDLYAQWIPLPPSTCYTLTYCGNDAEGPPARCVPSPQKVPAGQCAQISRHIPCRVCRCFAGWNTSPYGTGRMYFPGKAIGPVTGDVCLYAQWRRLSHPKPRCTCRKEPD